MSWKHGLSRFFFAGERAAGAGVRRFFLIVDAVKELIAAGANLNARGNKGTALEIAKKKRKKKLIKLLEAAAATTSP